MSAGWVTPLLVVTGGAVGAPLRYLVDRQIQARHDSVFPWGTLMVNVLGSLILGVVAAVVAAHAAAAWLLTLLGVGLCGALTTFSTFSYETVRLAQTGSWVVAALNTGASVAGSFAAVSV
ncbi:MAG: fluoride efflux transporter CrcB, partial [Tetrasphaera sp.]